MCIVTEAEGDVVCWRSNADTVPEEYPVPEFDEPQTQIVLSHASQCSIGVSGAMTCWGERVPDPPFVP